MKVLLINGSPHAKGSTYTALSQIAGELTARGIEAEIFHIGTQPISGCLGCRKCRETGKCCIDDIVNVAVEKAKESDGFIFGSPVYYASANGAMIAFMDRLFFSGSGTGAFRNKPAASVVCARRAGSTSAYDQLNKYIGIASMIMIPSVYWNMAIGHNAEEVLQDEEGMEIMRNLGRSMAWMLKVLQLGRANGLAQPE